MTLGGGDAQAYQILLRAPTAAFVLEADPDKGYTPAPMLLPDGRVNPRWRPLRKRGLSDASVRTALAALKSLSKYLVNVDYLRASPFTLGGLTRRHHNARHEVRKKVLRERAKAAVDAAIKAMLENTEAQRKRALRRRYVFDLFYYLGLRMDEAVNAQMFENRLPSLDDLTDQQIGLARTGIERHRATVSELKVG